LPRKTYGEVVNMMAPYYSGYGSDVFSGGGMIGMMFIGGFFFLIFIAGTVLLVMWLAQQGRSGMMMHGPMSGTHMDESLNILKKRYASGEITKEQFEQMKRDLS
jgi:putative membrane protein